MANFPVLVLEVLLKYVGVDDLISSRAVASSWNPIILKLLRNRLNYVDLRTPEQFSNFLELFSGSSSTVPFTRFILNPTFGTEDEVTPFLQMYGNSMTELSFESKLVGNINPPFYYPIHYMDTCYTRETIQRFSFILSKTPNLKMLDIQSDGEYSYISHSTLRSMIPVEGIPVPILPKLVYLRPGNPERWMEWIMALARNAPALQYISSYVFKKKEKFDFLNELKSRGVRCAFPALNGSDPAGVEHWFNAGAAHLRTSYKCINQETEDELRSVSYSAKNVEVIQLGSLPTGLTPRWEFVFPRVLEVHIWLWLWHPERPMFRPKNLPALRRIDIIGGHHPITLPPSEWIPHPFLTVRELHLGIHSDSHSMDWKWAQLFPNTEVLGISSSAYETDSRIEMIVEQVTPTFSRLRTFCFALDKPNNECTHDWNLLTGGHPKRLSFSGFERLEYTGDNIKDQLLPAIVRSVEAGLLDSLKGLFVHTVVGNQDEAEFQEQLEVLTDKFPVVWLSPNENELPTVVQLKNREAP